MASRPHQYSQDLIDQKLIAFGLSVAAIAIWYLVAVLSQFSSLGFFALPLFLGMYWIFDKWLWKWLPFGFYPDLNGKWSGVIEFREESPRPSADITLTIAQTFSTLLVESETEATLGGSMCGALLSDGANRMELRYSYRASFKPKVKDKIAQTGKPANLQDHVGFCVLVVDPKNKNSLIGSYFTDAPLKSSGSIVLHRKPEPA